jgi:ribosomal protein S18 acetylase RimI-like enzyme
MLLSLHNKAVIEAFVRQNPFVHLLEMGDLDEFFWDYTIWYALQDGGTIRQLALVYTAGDIPVLLANPEPPREQMRDLLRVLLPLLPRRFYAHLDPTQVDVFTPAYAIQPRGLHYKMGLIDRSRLDSKDASNVNPLSEEDLPALEALYRASYPGTMLSTRMLQTGWFYGIRERDAIVSVAGIHVYSRTYRIAVLGSVTTHPKWRRRGLGRAVCARLCQDLIRSGIEYIGLNVKSDNDSAIKLYQHLGFEVVAEFGAYTLKVKNY